MKVPTYQKYGLKKAQVERSDLRDVKVSHMLSHTLPLYLGVGFGLVVYVFYYIKIKPTDFLQIVTQIFLFATVGVICVGIPVVIFKLSERAYYKIMNTHSDEYINIREYKNSREGFDFWKLRTDPGFWNHLDGLSIENEIVNLFKYEEYSEIKNEDVLINRYDHILGKDGKNYYFAFRSNKVYEDIDETARLIGNLDNADCNELILIVPKGITKEITDYITGKPAKYFTVKEIIALIKTINK